MTQHHLIKLALVALAAVAAYYVFAFSVLVMPWWIAVFAAASLVSTYIGLAFADVPAAARPRAIRVATAAMIVEAAYGVLYVLSLQSPEWFMPPLNGFMSILLAVLHGGAFSVLAFFVSLLVVHRDDTTTLQQQLVEALEERDNALVEARQWQRIATDSEQRLSELETTRSAPRQLTADTDRLNLPAPTKPTKKDQIAQLARQHRCSTRTIERRIEKGLITLEENEA